MTEPPTPRSVVVGIDGSRAAIHAALWAVDEAVARDIPLRLLYAIEPDDTQQNLPDRATRRFAIAENAVRYVSMAVESVGKPVRIEVEIAQERPIIALIRASASAAMVCVGAVGVHHFRPERVGSTVAKLATSAHCPVAIIRGHGDRARRDARWIVVDPHRSADIDAVMGTAIEEARLRDLPLRAVSYRQRGACDYAAEHLAASGDRQVLFNQGRRLERWKRRYPDVEVNAVVLHGSLLDYLSENGRSVRLVIIGVHNHELVEQLVGPVGNAVLNKADCSVLVVDHQHL
ncbi:universal stress protein [Mycobacterium riyadhense]|uniref:universal stress protein n=1 Tax=Mycobacterium riyadhense TaxID=486698 RepID=UPI00195220C1|nr:universal stress protein [Mycobacterium riyadhense]